MLLRSDQRLDSTRRAILIRGWGFRRLIVVEIIRSEAEGKWRSHYQHFDLVIV
jgi:hypothetical protein